MDSAVGKKYKDQEIVISSETAYVSCTFSNCHLIYMGGDFSLLKCKIENCQLTFAGEAGKTLQFMQTVGMLPPQGTPPLAQLPESGSLH